MTTRLLLVASLALVTGCSAYRVKSTEPAAKETEAQTQTTTDEPLLVIDAHTHTDFSDKHERTSGITDSKEQYFREWREAGVVGAVSHSSSPEEKQEDLRAYGVTHCMGMRAKVNVAKVEAGLKSGQYGCLKIYLGYIAQWAYDPAYEPVYKLAEKYGVPVVFHTGDTYDQDGFVKYADPLQIDEVAVKHRKVNFVIAHCGNPWHQTAAQVAYKNDNVYIECSAMMIGDIKKEADADLRRYLIDPTSWIFGYIGNPKKMMFGTDWPLVGIKDYLEAYKRAIPREHWRAVFHDNAVKVFKMKPLKAPPTP